MLIDTMETQEQELCEAFSHIFKNAIMLDPVHGVINRKAKLEMKFTPDEGLKMFEHVEN